jgi:hypothetical protein
MDVAAAMTIIGVFDCVAKRCGRKRKRGQSKTRDGIHLVVDDELLHEASRLIRDAAIVPDEQLDSLARDGIAVLLQVELRAGRYLLAGRRERPRERRDQADFVRLLRLRGSEERESHHRREHGSKHRDLPGVFVAELSCLPGFLQAATARDSAIRNQQRCRVRPACHDTVWEQ